MLLIMNYKDEEDNQGAIYYFTDEWSWRMIKEIMCESVRYNKI
jgi:DNA-binding MltR family transcriptional regulator